MQDRAPTENCANAVPNNPLGRGAGIGDCPLAHLGRVLSSSSKLLPRFG